MPFEVRPNPFHLRLGAGVHGLDLSKPPDDETVRALDAARVHHKLPVFVDQHIDGAQHIAFTRNFGELVTFPMKTVRCLHVTQQWHIDSSYRKLPSKGAVFRGITLTRQGGETWFCDLEDVYKDLPAATRNQVDELQAVHDFETSCRCRAKRSPRCRYPRICWCARIRKAGGDRCS